VADGTVQILGLGTSAAPLEYTVSGSQALDLLAVKATFDGTAAGVDFVPVVEIVSDADVVMASGVGSKITAGGSATVTFAPFLKAATSTVAGAGIQFDVNPQSGTFLVVTTSTFQEYTASIIGFDTTGGTQISFATGTSFVVGAGTNIQIDANTGMVFRPGNGDYEVHLTAGNAVIVYNGSNVKTTQFLEDGNVDMRGLPIADPGISGRLWNNGGVVNISP
jgi:hypothetical protein